MKTLLDLPKRNPDQEKYLQMLVSGQQRIINQGASQYLQQQRTAGVRTRTGASGGNQPQQQNVVMITQPTASVEISSLSKISTGKLWFCAVVFQVPVVNKCQALVSYEDCPLLVVYYNEMVLRCLFWTSCKLMVEKYCEYEFWKQFRDFFNDLMWSDMYYFVTLVSYLIWCWLQHLWRSILIHRTHSNLFNVYFVMQVKSILNTSLHDLIVPEFIEWHFFWLQLILLHARKLQLVLCRRWMQWLIRLLLLIYSVLGILRRFVNSFAHLLIYKSCCYELSGLIFLICTGSWSLCRLSWLHQDNECIDDCY